MEGRDGAVRIESLLAHRDWVRRVARALTSDEAAASDLEQEAWLRALRDPPREDRGLRAWFGTVLRNTAWNMRRSDRRRRAYEAAATSAHAIAPPPDLVAEAELHERVVRLVLDLEEPYRTAMLVRWFEDLPPAAMAGRLAIPVETVRTRLRRALEMLRVRLDRESAGDRRRWVLALGPLARVASDLESRGRIGPTAATAAAAGGLAMAAEGKAVLVAAVLLALSTGAILVAGGGDPPAGVEFPAATDPATPETAHRTPPSAARTPAVVAEVPRPAPTVAPAAIPEPISVPRRRLVVRDVVSGEGVPDLALRVDFRPVDTREDAEEELCTDREGAADFPASGIRAVEAVAPGWMLVGPVTDRSPELWVSRAVEVRGTVRAGSADAFDPGKATVRVVLGFASHSLGTQTVPSPWKGPWSTMRGAAPSDVGEVHPGPDGEYRLRVPVAPEVFVRATCPGWLPALSGIPGMPAADGERVDLVLERVLPRVSLVVRDSSGNPVPGVEVQVFASARMRPEDTRAFLMRYGAEGGLTATSGADGAEVNLICGGRTEADGSIAADLRIPGEVLVAVGPLEGHAPRILRLGRVDTALESIAVDLPALDPSRKVRLSVGGVTFPCLRITIAPLFKEGPQPATPVVLDADGRMPAQYLDAGVRYGFILASDAGMQIVEWTGDRDEVDIPDAQDRDGVWLSERIRRALEEATGAPSPPPRTGGSGGSSGAAPK
jgi:RNA polymerase sigma-70 factor (ECF subfamily)